MPFDFTQDEWDRAKVEAKDIMRRAAVSPQGTIDYQTFVDTLEAIRLNAKDPRLDELLRQCAVEEDADGRGLLAVVVVHRNGDHRPGNGFYDMARDAGRTHRNRETLWVEEVRHVSDAAREFLAAGSP